MNVYLFARLFKCLNICLCICLNKHLCVCVIVHLWNYTNTQMHKITNTQSHKTTKSQMHNQSFHLSFTPITVCSVVLLSSSVRMGNRQYSVLKPACVTMPCGVKV